MEQLDEYLEKLKEYTKKLYTLGSRNSYSKTDPDATFMRMKEDAILNGSEILALSSPHRFAVRAWVVSLPKRAKNEVCFSGIYINHMVN